jgi:hypothetical protein
MSDVDPHGDGERRHEKLEEAINSATKFEFGAWL